jgi:hypothetical protein
LLAQKITLQQTQKALFMKKAHAQILTEIENDNNIGSEFCPKRQFAVI